MICFLLIINLLVPGDASLGFIEITSSFKIYFSALYNTLYIVLRLIIMLGVSMILTSTTTPLQLTGALEWYMYPLKVIKFPVHEIAMTISLALRFIPTLIEEIEKITNAQKARGADFESGKFMDRVKAVVPILIPLFVSSFRRAYELAFAMTCRCYTGGEGRTRMKQMKLAGRDFAALFVCVALTAGVIVLNIFFEAVI